ncbi:MAG: ATP-binding protein [Neomegalonema sp.]|nr:ATP-binding protein [Neomegalonema sp.]
MSFLRRYMPKGLFWRTILIVVTPIVALQLIIVWLIIERHFDGVTRQLTESVSAELSYVVSVINSAESEADARRGMEQAALTLSIELDLKAGEKVPPSVDPLFYDVIGNAVEETLLKRLGRPLFVAYDRDRKVVDVRAQTRWGLLKATLSHRRMVASNPHLLLTWTAAAAAALIGVALLYLRNQIRPIEQLAKAAHAFGRGQNFELNVAGAREVRQASSAFLDARARIERHIEQRTRMLSGVSHDLRTPLTRMRLALDLMDETDEVVELRSDVDEMADIIEEFLAYARGDQGESFSVADVAELVDEVAAETRRAGRKLSVSHYVETPGETRLSIRPRAIKRCLHNLLENAFSYGGQVALAVTVNRAFVEFVIEDDGPGIAEEARDAAMRPFSRLDESRNRNRGGGVGLGLALALDTARSHGGDITLGESAMLGGLRAAVRLPR